MSPDLPYGQGARMLELNELCEWLNITNGTPGSWSSETRFPTGRWAACCAFRRLRSSSGPVPGPVALRLVLSMPSLRGFRQCRIGHAPVWCFPSR
jgi:hypothetical protein